MFREYHRKLNNIQRISKNIHRISRRNSEYYRILDEGHRIFQEKMEYLQNIRRSPLAKSKEKLESYVQLWVYPMNNYKEYSREGQVKMVKHSQNGKT
jgi:DNA-binding PadR family transcriptional regulator